MFGIGNCPVSYGKYLFRPEWIMKHGLPEYSNECQSDCIGKFLMDDIRRLAQKGNPQEIMVRCYIRDKLLARVKYVVESGYGTEQLEKTASATSSVLLSKVLSQGTSASMEYANRLSSLMPEWAIFTAEAALRFGFTPMHAPVVSRQLAELEVDSICFSVTNCTPPQFCFQGDSLTSSGVYFVFCCSFASIFHSKFVFATYFVRFPFVQLRPLNIIKSLRHDRQLPRTGAYAIASGHHEEDIAVCFISFCCCVSAATWTWHHRAVICPCIAIGTGGRELPIYICSNQTVQLATDQEPHCCIDYRHFTRAASTWCCSQT
jgi:hypothetical protein